MKGMGLRPATPKPPARLAGTKAPSKRATPVAATAPKPRAKRAPSTVRAGVRAHTKPVRKRPAKASKRKVRKASSS